MGMNSADRPRGKVYLVGAGPGAVDLLTLRAFRLLEQSDVVLHDDLVSAETLAVATRATLIAVGKRCGRKSALQATINEQLVLAARDHALVVRLKGGDPAIFGRLDEEVLALQEAGIAYEVVPGITSASAAAAALGRSLTRRGKARQVTLATPRSGKEFNDDVLSALNLTPDGTTVFYMGSKMAGRIARMLLGRGFAADMPVAIVANVSWGDQKIVRTTVAMLAVSAAAIGDAPALIVVGETAALHSGQQAERDGQADREPGERTQDQREQDGRTAEVLCSTREVIHLG